MKKFLAVSLFSLWSLSLCFGQTGNQFILQVQNSGTAVYTASSFAVLNLTSGCSGTVSSGVLSITCTGAGGGTTTNALTLNSGGAGAASGATFNGSGAITLSYNTLGAAPLASPTFTGTVLGSAATFTALTGSTSLTAGIVGTTAGLLNLSGSTSGTATFTAPAVAGTSSNAVVSSNAISAPSYTATGGTSGFFQFGQGSTNAVGTTDITEQAPAAVTSYLVIKPGTAASGLAAGTNVSGTITQNFTGSAAFSTGAVTTGSGASIGATSLCTITNCPAGTYQISAYLDVTTACTATGTYFVSLIYTDDAASKTIVMPLQGTGTTTTFGPSAITSSLGLASTTNFATGSVVLRSTGAAAIQYSTTAGACGTGGPMVGKMFLTVVPLS